MLKMRKRMGLRTRKRRSTLMKLSPHMARPGWCLALSPALLSCCAPGVPCSVLQCSVFGPPLPDLSRGRTLALASSPPSAPDTSY